ncbi:MAG: VWA domain-containing protein [Crenarchaeota archaeon]|nr:VWA domain-containing protein [Thermoproteota archaeon]
MLNEANRLDPISLISDILKLVYEYLQTDTRVIRPGSIRSYEAAVADIFFRLLLEGGEVDEEKFREIVTRVGIQNLLLSVETQSPEEKRLVLEEAFEYALNRAMKRIEQKIKEGLGEPENGEKRKGEKKRGAPGAEGEEREGEQRGQGQGQGSARRRGKGSSLKEGSEMSDLTSDELVDFAGSKMLQELSKQGSYQYSRRSASAQMTGEIIEREVEEVAENDEVEQMISTIYEAFYGGIGAANFMNLAQLINMFVKYDANIIKKVQVLKKLEKYLRSYGFASSTYTKVSSQERRIFEEFRRKTKGQSSDMSQIKIMKFVGSDRYPTYVVNMREYKFGDSYSNIDMYKTAINISRKSLMGKMITTKDIIVKEYANVKSIDLVLCLDVSGSMRELSWGTQKIDIAKDAVSKYVQFLMTTNDRLSLILFNFRADVLWTLHQVKRYWKYMLYMLSYVYAGGGTNLAHALERAREVLSKSRSTAKHVVCVTDGRTVNAQLCIREVTRLRRQGATISTIAIGENSDDDLLMKLSRIGGGLFIKIINIHDLSRALIIDKLHFL